MALTYEQRASVYRYLGRSYFDADAWKMEQRLNEFESRPEDEAIIIGLLDKCDALMTRIDGMTSRWKVTELGGIQLRAHYELAGHQKLGRIYSGQIAHLMGMTKRGDAFSQSLGHESGFPGGGGSAWNFPPMG